MAELLIDRNDFELYRPLPESLDFNSMVHLVLRAQRGWLRSALGGALYYDLHTNPALSRNADLLNGTTYAPNGNTLDFYGVKPAIVCYAYALYLKQADLRVTKAGNKRKRANESENASAELVSAEFGKAMAEGQAYMEEALAFLSYNSSTYTLWDARQAPRGSVRVGMRQQGDFYSEDDNYKYDYLGANGRIDGY